jgi:hypothetical protein
MSQYPHELQPSTFEVIELSNGRRVKIAKATPRFQRWVGTAVINNYGSKAVLDFAGQPSFAELLVLRLFENSGWSGVWVDSFARRNRLYWGEDTSVALPGTAERMLNVIRDRDMKARCWDVFCWRDDEIFFAELKRKSHDRIRDSQRRWLAAALEEGLDLKSFLIVEWDLETREAV